MQDTVLGEEGVLVRVVDGMRGRLVVVVVVVRAAVRRAPAATSRPPGGHRLSLSVALQGPSKCCAPANHTSPGPR